MIRVYVAGPYTKGDMAVNVANAIEVADMLLKAGYAPYLPHLTHFWHMHRPGPYAQWTALDNEWVPLCHALWRMPGGSSGADAEVVLAEEHGLPVVRTLAELNAAAVQIKEKLGVIWP